MGYKMNLLKMFKALLFILFTGNMVFAQSEIDNVVKYSLGFDRANIHSGEVITLTADLKIMKNYYVYSSHPEKSLSPSNIEWQDSSYFSAVGVLREPTPKT